MLRGFSSSNFVFDVDVDQSVTDPPPSDKIDLSPLTSAKLQSKRWEAPSYKFWPMFVVCVGFLVMMCLSGQPSVRSIERGMILRRLARGEDSIDEIPLPPSPVLRDLCIAMGPWSPVDSRGAQPRASPQMVEDFFMNLMAAPHHASPKIVEDVSMSLESDLESATILPGSEFDVEVEALTSDSPRKKEQECFNTTLYASPGAAVSLKQ